MSEVAVTLKDVAARAGVSTATVSLALRDRASVALATREHVRRIAGEMGYRPHGAASLLAQHRHSARLKPENGSIPVAWFGNRSWLGSNARRWRTAVMDRVASRNGLAVEWIDPTEFSSPATAARVLYNRGFQGVLIDREGLAPWNKVDRARFEWDRFSGVKMGRSLPDIPLPVVRHSPFDYMSMTLRKAGERGCRIAAILHNSQSRQDDAARLGALMAFQVMEGQRGVRVEYRYARDELKGPLCPETLAWLRSFEPDVIVLDVWPLFYALLEAGFQIPEQVRVAAVISIREPVRDTPRITGCDRVLDQIYDHACVVMRERILLGKRGLGSAQADLVLEPVWLEGETL